MRRVRTRFLLLTILAADITIAFGGIPLLRYTWVALAQRAQDAALLTQLLAANLTMLLLVLSAMAACGIVGARVISLALRRFPIFSALPIPVQQTKSQR